MVELTSTVSFIRSDSNNTSHTTLCRHAGRSVKSSREEMVRQTGNEEEKNVAANVRLTCEGEQDQLPSYMFINNESASRAVPSPTD